MKWVGKEGNTEEVINIKKIGTFIWTISKKINQWNKKYKYIKIISFLEDRTKKGPTKGLRQIHYFCLQKTNLNTDMYLLSHIYVFLVTSDRNYDDYITAIARNILSYDGNIYSNP
jgi:hypothetical protein